MNTFLVQAFFVVFFFGKYFKNSSFVKVSFFNRSLAIFFSSLIWVFRIFVHLCSASWTRRFTSMSIILAVSSENSFSGNSHPWLLCFSLKIIGPSFFSSPIPYVITMLLAMWVILSKSFEAPVLVSPKISFSAIRPP